MSATNYTINKDSGEISFTYDNKTYILSIYAVPDNGKIVSINDSGLVYAARGEIKKVDNRNYIDWKRMIRLINFVTITFEVPKDGENPTGIVSRAYEINKLVDPVGNIYYSPGDMWRYFMIDPQFFGKIKVGIYLRNKEQNTYVMAVITPVNGQDDKLDIATYFNLSPYELSRSGPYNI